MEQSVYDRLWWSILLRDRCLSLGLRRKPQVTQYELRAIPDLPQEESFETEINTSEVYDPETKRRIFMIFQEQCQLAVLLTEMVSIVFDHGLSIHVLSREHFLATLDTLNKTRFSLLLWEQCSLIPLLEKQNTRMEVVKVIQLTMMYYQ